MPNLLRFSFYLAVKDQNCDCGPGKAGCGDDRGGDVLLREVEGDNLMPPLPLKTDLILLLEKAAAAWNLTLMLLLLLLLFGGSSSSNSLNGTCQGRLVTNTWCILGVYLVNVPILK